MRTGDGSILAALLGVGVVSSAGLDRPRTPSPVEATARYGGRGEAIAAAPEAALRAVAASGHADVRDSIAAGPSGSAPASIARSASPAAPSSEVAPVVVEAPVGEAPLARFERVDDRGLALVVDAAGGLAVARPVEGGLALDGRPVLVHVAASWCQPCARELAGFTALAARAERAVLVLAEDIGGPAGLAAAADALADAASPSSRAWPAGLELRADPTWAWMRWLGREALPVTAVIDADGGLRLVASGPLDADAAARVAALTEAP